MVSISLAVNPHTGDVSAFSMVPLNALEMLRQFPKRLRCSCARCGKRFFRTMNPSVLMRRLCFWNQYGLDWSRINVRWGSSREVAEITVYV